MMNFAEKYWVQLSAGDRIHLLDRLEVPDAEQFCSLEVDQLPKSVSKKLILAVTSTGFSIDEYRRCTSLITSFTQEEV